jgi:hypothetical protein
MRRSATVPAMTQAPTIMLVSDRVVDFVLLSTSICCR